jgi:hypothetical protein
MQKNSSPFPYAWNKNGQGSNAIGGFHDLLIPLDIMTSGGHTGRSNALIKNPKTVQRGIIENVLD